MHQEKENPNKIRKERGEIATNITEIQNIIRKFCSYTPRKSIIWKKWAN